MKIIQNPKALQRAIESLRRSHNRQKIGFVPTMGCLHDGHLKLVCEARKHNDVVVVSIFVNPMQFGPKEDFLKYPRPLARDKKLLIREKVDLLFIPNKEIFYPPNFQSSICVKELSRPLCGKRRAGHFEGVATVVAKLLNIVIPDTLYLGQKDYQQCRVISQMIKDLNFRAKVAVIPTVRDKDGLALSSRNNYLSAAERKEALFIYRSLCEAKRRVASGIVAAQRIKDCIKNVLSGAPKLRLDYLEIVHAQTLKPVVELEPGSQALIAIAAFVGETRLIDNLLIRIK